MENQHVQLDQRHGLSHKPSGAASRLGSCIKLQDRHSEEKTSPGGGRGFLLTRQLDRSTISVTVIDINERAVLKQDVHRLVAAERSPVKILDTRSFRTVLRLNGCFVSRKEASDVC